MVDQIEFQLIAAGRDICGESPIWCEHNNSVYWVDINGRKIHKFNTKSAEHNTWACPSFPGAMAITRDAARAIIACSDGIKLFDFKGHFQAFAHPEASIEGNRYNEGKCDPKGRFWTGSMQNNIAGDGGNLEMNRDSGGLYRIGPDGSAHCLIEPSLGIANTMAWDLERRRFYFADSLAGSIYRFDYDQDEGAISNQALFAKTEGYGVPDGSCLDEQGYLWNTRYGGRAIIRYAPDGSIDRIIDVPVTNPTSCCFGGPDLRTLYVTSAANGVPEAELQSNPFEGSLFAFEPGVQGRPEYAFQPET